MARIKMGAPETKTEAPDSERAAIQTEAIIAEKMNAALAATVAKVGAAEGVVPPPPAQPLAATIADAQKALGPGFFGGTVVPPSIASVVPAMSAPTVINNVAPPLAIPSEGSESEEATWTHGEELYGKQGTFSQYRVGPFVGKTRVRAGETHSDALERLKRELRAQADEERAAAHARFMDHWKKNIA